MKRISTLLFVLILPFAAFSDAVKVSAFVVPNKLSAGAEATVSVRFDIAGGYHIYGLSATDESGMATKISLELPSGFETVSSVSPQKKTFEFFGAKYEGYDGTPEFFYIVRAPKKISQSGKIDISAEISWLACSSTCEPGKASIPLEIFLEKSSKIRMDDASNAISEGGVSPSLLPAILGAILGGMILNLMPCVFPVLALKAMSFASSSAEEYKKRLLSALFYALGIWVSFLALAWLLAALHGAGKSLGWGFQLQNPTFVAAMALLFFAMGLSFAGAYEIGAGLGNIGIAADSHSRSKYMSSALSGVLAVLVASPCTAPFMGGAVGAAFSSDASAFSLTAIFTALAFGMAFPYVALAAIPALARLMPRPGAWMETLKNILSIPLFASAIWLAWIYQRQTGGATNLLSAALVAAVGLRIYGIYSLPHFSGRTRTLSLVCALLALAGALWLSAAEPSNSGETPDISRFKISEDAWSEEKLRGLLASGNIVYVDFTASWCLSCQYNKTILDSPEIRKIFRDKKIKILTGDWTDKNAAIFAELKKFGRAGVPLNLLYSPATPASPQVLPAVLTKSAILEAVDKISE